MSESASCNRSDGASLGAALTRVGAAFLTSRPSDWCHVVPLRSQCRPAPAVYRRRPGASGWSLTDGHPARRAAPRSRLPGPADSGGSSGGRRAPLSDQVQEAESALPLSPTARSPAARSPLGEVRPLHTENTVVAVAGVEPGLVREHAEDALFEVVHQRAEVARTRGPSRTARKQRVAGEQVRDAGRVPIQDGDGARGV